MLDDLIAQALKREDVGFFAPVAVKGALLVVKPKIRQAIEAMRQGMMFMTMVHAQTHFREAEVSALTDAYIEEFMPFESETEMTPGADDHERAVNAVRNRRWKIEAKTKPAEPAAGETANASPVP